MLFDFTKTLILAVFLICVMQALLMISPAGALSLLLAGVGVVAWAVFVEPNRLILKHQTILLSNCPSRRDGMKVAVIGCLHAGSPFIDRKKIQRIVSLINEEKPEMVMLLGDFVGTVVVFGRSLTPEIVARELKELKAPLGVFAVMGNHDLWHGKERISSALESSGITVLENTSVTIGNDSHEPLTLVGIAFDDNPRQSVQKAFSSLPGGQQTMAMAHSPDVFPFVPSHVVLTCASHTHGGQIRLPFIGALLVPCRTGSRYASGHFEENGKQLFVTSGVGTSMLPARFFCPPEIVILNISRQSAVLTDGKGE